jgi:hypothetical protein
MSHHFDSELAKKDPRLNLTDVYLFDGPPGRTVMAMTANPGAGVSAPDYFHDESLYSFRFRLAGALTDELVFKFSFSLATHAPGNDHRHIQTFKLMRAMGDQIPGDGGDLIAHGSSGEVQTAADNIKVFVGTVPDMWAADAPGFFNFKRAFHGENRFAPEMFAARKSSAHRNVTAIVLEMATDMIAPEGTKVQIWANISLFGHAPETQVSRYGLPLFTHLFLRTSQGDMDVNAYHQLTPDHDVERFGPGVMAFATGLSRAAGIVRDPEAHGKHVAEMVCPSLITYELGSAARFAVDRFNGRRFDNDAFDVMLTLTAGTPVSDGASPPVERSIPDFPYYGTPYSRDDQTGLPHFTEDRPNY